MVTKPLGDAALQHEVGERHVAGVGGVGTPAGGVVVEGEPQGNPTGAGEGGKGEARWQQGEEVFVPLRAPCVPQG